MRAALHEQDVVRIGTGDLQRAHFGQPRLDFCRRPEPPMNGAYLVQQHVHSGTTLLLVAGIELPVVLVRMPIRQVITQAVFEVQRTPYRICFQ